MGTDIYVTTQALQGEEWLDIQYFCDPGMKTAYSADEPFGERNYDVFAFLAGERNRAGIEPIAKPRGVPGGYAEPDPYDDPYSHSWLTVAELLAYDYEKTVRDQDEGGRETSLRELLGRRFFEHLKALEKLAGKHGGPERVRIVFWFD